jgi:hypothetical protein
MVATGPRRLSPVQWNRDGCLGFDIRANEDVPVFDDGMIRRALLRGSLLSENVRSLTTAINRQLWEIGYVARVRVQSDPADRSVIVEVSKAS